MAFGRPAVHHVFSCTKRQIDHAPEVDVGPCQKLYALRLQCEVVPIPVGGGCRRGSNIRIRNTNINLRADIAAHTRSVRRCQQQQIVAKPQMRTGTPDTSDTRVRTRKYSKPKATSGGWRDKNVRWSRATSSHLGKPVSAPVRPDNARWSPVKATPSSPPE